ADARSPRAVARTADADNLDPGASGGDLVGASLRAPRGQLRLFLLGLKREMIDQDRLCLSRHAQPAELDLSEWLRWTPVELFGDTRFPRIPRPPSQLWLGPYMFLWFRLEGPGPAEERA